MQTIRQQIKELLGQAECTARDISQTLRMSEKEVYQHLAHIARSVATQKKRLVVIPPSCTECGYVFADRKRFTRPSRCPRCKCEHTTEPKYRID